MRIVLFALCAMMFAAAPVCAEPLEGEYLYKVTTVRAAPGELEGLIDWTRKMIDAGFFDDAGEPQPLIMRHSQGDQWDLLKITPMGSWAAYHSRRNTRRRGAANIKHEKVLMAGFAKIAFAEDHFAYGPPWEAVRAAHAENGFFHIEMFKAAPGKAAALMEQRRMENTYLGATGQTPNMIFRRAAGSDVDVFTIGFHQTLQAFAAPSGASPEEAEAAAKAAGFKDRADISFFLRSLLSGHHDTLAVKVE